MSEKRPKIGLLSLQGAFAAHGGVLRSLGAETVEVRLPRELDGLDGLVLPGGESTTLLRLFDEYGFEGPIRALAVSGKPILATCMGFILLAKQISSPVQESLELVDVSLERNAYGRQVDSFEGEGEVMGKPFHMVFIRAPRIVDVGKGVDVLGLFQGKPVLVRQGKMLCATFHPELTEDDTIHRLFLKSFSK